VATEVDVQQARTTLEQVLADLESTTTTLEGEHAEESSELSNVSQHAGDTDAGDVDREHAILEANAAQRQEVQAALGRIEDGTYGRCVDCGEQIAAARLEFKPEAARCLEDQQKHEAQQA